MDDGRGVDPALISKAAVRLGILAGEAPLDIERSLRMIFRPGFTTLDVLSDLSGRGVGLDVVETSVEQVGGELRVSSQFGAGTTFEIRLPVTFGVIPTNVVVSAGNRYCIPTAQTLGIDAIDVVDGSSGANQLRQVSMRDLWDNRKSRTIRRVSYISSLVSLTMKGPAQARRNQNASASSSTESRDHRKCWLEIWDVMRDAGTGLPVRLS